MEIKVEKNQVIVWTGDATVTVYKKGEKIVACNREKGDQPTEVIKR